MFAKLYENTKHGQILVMLDATDDGEPVIKYCCQPKGLGVCYALSPPFENSDEGWTIAEQTFKDENEKSATELVEVVILAALEEMEIVEISYEEQKLMYEEQKLMKQQHILH
jgi:hypothetical protein